MDKKALEGLVWKGSKQEGHNFVRLVECDLATLQRFYTHCMDMLHNKDTSKPGRYELIKRLDDILNHCRAELLVRWLRSERGYTYQHCYEDIKAILRNSELKAEDVSIGQLMCDIPEEYKRVPVTLVLRASTYSLGVCDTSPITLSFILSLGIYLTQQELQKELLERDIETGKVKNRLEVIKAREGLNPSTHLEIKQDGLSYEEFHQLLKLRKERYERLTTSVLKLLSTKVLYRLQQRCEAQARLWEQKASEIAAVCEDKGWNISHKWQ